MEDRDVLGPRQLEEELAARVHDERFQRGKLGESRPGSLECCIEDSERYQPGRVGMLLIIGIQHVDENPKELKNRRESICVEN
jgi:hypothetical protein